jgi:hypothetical protein
VIYSNTVIYVHEISNEHVYQPGSLHFTVSQLIVSQLVVPLWRSL